MLRSPAKSASTTDLRSLSLENEVDIDNQLQNINTRKRVKLDQDVSPTKLEDMMFRMQKSFDEINKNINDVVKVELSNLTSVSSEIKAELNSLRRENTELKSSIEAMYAQQQETVALVTDLRASLDFTSNRVDILNKRVDKCEEHCKRDDELANELKTTKQALKTIETDLNRQQQRDRLLNLEITGIPEAKTEELPIIFQQIATISGVSLSADDFEHINRVQPKQPVKGRPRSIVVKLKNRIHKDNIIAGIRKRRGITTKDLNLPGDSKPVYVNEHLTTQNKLLYKKCREVAANKMIKYVWIRHCNIFMRKDDTSPAVLINAEDDLKKFR
ncbi:uncharacterized protein LOC135080265 [Ostrinia nubilalis]|uniref:uncharacterized protein LOC135080265 n=1 Tax=Ostrinia nubilalis TaxID=29057 RepID=UPI003082224D